MVKKWEIESAARTLIEAEEIRQDGKRFSAARREIVKQQKAAEQALARNSSPKKNQGGDSAPQRKK